MNSNTEIPPIRQQRRNRSQNISMPHTITNFYLSDVFEKSKRKKDKSTPIEAIFNFKASKPLDHTAGTSQSFVNLVDIKEKQKYKNLFLNKLNRECRTYFYQNNEFKSVFSLFDSSLFELVKVISVVKRYRIELGIQLEKMSSSLFQSFIRLSNLCYKKIEEINRIKENVLQENKHIMISLDNEIKRLSENNISLESMVKIKQSEIDHLEVQNSSLYSEMDYLRKSFDNFQLLSGIEWTQEGLIDYGKLSVSEDQKIKFFESCFTELKSKKESLDTWIDVFSKENEVKSKFLENMDSTIRSMIKGKKRDRMIQVNIGELPWAAENLLEEITVNKPKLTPTSLIQTGPMKNAEISKQKLMKTSSLFRSMVSNKGTSMESTIGIGIPEADLIWNIPLEIKLFISHVLRENQQVNPLSWIHLKDIIFDFYEFVRNNHAAINGKRLHSAVRMEEFLCLYFLQKFKMRRLAESKLLEFLVSLKSNLKNWPRAYICAYLCNLIISKDLSRKDQEDLIDDTRADIYVQNYFIYAYSHIMGFASLLEEEPGSKILRIPLVNGETIVKKIAEMISPDKWLEIVSRMSDITQTAPESTFLDIDRILLFLVDEFNNERKLIKEEITRKFLKACEGSKGFLSTTQIKNICGDEIFDRESLDNQLLYPAEINITHAYLNALVISKNEHSIDINDLLLAFRIYGIDSPFPSCISYNTSSEFAGNTASGDLIDFSPSTKQGRKSIISPPKIKSNKQSQPSSFRGIKKNDPQKSKFDKSQIGSDRKERRGSIGKSELKEATATDSLKKERDGYINLMNGSSMFAQHFSIIRELRNQVHEFKEKVDQIHLEVEPDLWAKLNAVSKILETGCDYFHYPTIV